MRTSRVAGFAKRNAESTIVPGAQVGDESHRNVRPVVDSTTAAVLWERRDGELSADNGSLRQRVGKLHFAKFAPFPLGLVLSQALLYLFNRLPVTRKNQLGVRLVFLGQPLGGLALNDLIKEKVA